MVGRLRALGPAASPRGGPVVVVVEVIACLVYPSRMLINGRELTARHGDAIPGRHHRDKAVPGEERRRV